MIDKSHPFAQKILDLRDEGKPFQQIIRAAAREGYFLKTAEIKEFLMREVPDVETERSKPGTKKTKIIIDVDAILSRFGIEKVETPEQIMDANQRLASHAMLIQQAILIGRLEAHAEGLCTYPEDVVRGFKAIAETYRALWGYDEQVSIKSALMTLTSEGYQIEHNKIKLPMPNPSEVDYIIESSHES